ncbi:FAD-dependent oxidoreductase [Desulfocurvibacter africanus]|uniref:NAD(P)/FAD-dependent oxidoreductase n=1 Tax=Desulfocurvibacter africanus TaxID=873 RepID=UPI002FDB7789
MTYVIIGGGASTLGAIEGIRRYDKQGRIVVISAENEPIYGRPLISYMLAGKIGSSDIPLRPSDYYEKNLVELKLGTTVTSIDIQKRCVVTSAGETIGYDKLMLATGGTPFNPPFPGLQGPGIYNFTTAEHARVLDKLAGSLRRVVVIGGGLIGLKAAEALFDRGVDVSIVELAPRVLSAAFDDDAGNLVQGRLHRVGLHIYCKVSAKEIKRGEDGTLKGVLLSDGRFLEAEAVVVAIGVVPEKSLATAAGLKVDRGIQVDDRLQTSVPGIYAAGDVVQALDMIAGDNRVVPIWPNAYNQGFTAGMNMAGADRPFEGGLAMNSISFYGLATTSVGLVNPPEEGFDVHTLLNEQKQSYRKLVFKEDRLVGYVLVGDIDCAGLYTGFIRFKLPLTSEVKEQLISGQPCALLWPEEIFKNQWNPESGTAAS